VYRFALRLTNDAHMAEDLTQEVFLRAWRRRWLLRKPQSMRVWLFRITVNLWRDQLRRGKLRVARLEPLPEDYAAGGQSPEKAAADQDDLRQALAALDELPPRQRDVLYLAACEELRAADIADVLDMRIDAVKASLSIARRKLRERLRHLFSDLFLVL
jgi:RNA polymerase sigma-70 factor (ECF subfamily)